MNNDIKTIPAPEWSQKAWGQTKCVFRGHNFEVHELRVSKGGYCSRHRHRKFNRFHVMSGSLKVEHFETPDAQPVDRILAANDFFEVAPNRFHRFSALEDCHLLEIYWTEDIDPNDIERLDEGGLTEPKE